MINDKLLRENNYSLLQVTVNLPVDFQRHADKMYQKLVKDGNTKKYFINAYFYDSELFPQYEFEIYGHLPNGVATQTLFYGIHDLSLEQVEDMIEDYFINTHMLPYEEDPDA